MNYCIILYDRVFEQFRMFNHLGLAAHPCKDFAIAQGLVKQWGYAEVPINSRMGRQILAKIGERKV